MLDANIYIRYAIYTQRYVTNLLNPRFDIWGASVETLVLCEVLEAALGHDVVLAVAVLETRVVCTDAPGRVGETTSICPPSGTL
jgi:hypothetical protein